VPSGKAQVHLLYYDDEGQSMQAYEKAPIQWPDKVIVKTDDAEITFLRVPDTSYYRYAGDDGAVTVPPARFLSIDPPWLAFEGRIIVVPPHEEELQNNPALENAFQFIVL
jgi:hypothetical protein